MTSTPAVFPFIIWTLQRTGGTNLTVRLVELSGLKSAPHEPFNEERVYGHITRAWNESRNLAALDAAVRQVIAKREVIKHCVETVPWEVTELLAKAAAQADYRHLFLYRESPLDRLLSLHFARVSGIWGPGMKTGKALTGAPEPPKAPEPDSTPFNPLPVKILLQHERKCVGLLKKLWDMLEAANAMPIALAYEHIYHNRDLGQVGQMLRCILLQLGLSVADDVFTQWVKDVVGKGDQGTRQLYRQFPGYAELAKRCDDLPRFVPRARTL